MPQFMLAGSLRLINTRVDHRHRPDHNRNEAFNLTKKVKKSLAVDTVRRSEVTAEDMGDCLKTPKGALSDLQRVYLILKQWYQHA